MRILLATDGSSCSDAAVDEVARRPWPERTEVRVVSVADLSVVYPVEPWVVTPDYHDALKRALVDQASVAAAEAAEKLRSVAGERLEVTMALLNGPPKRAILEEAERWAADMIVLGSHGYGRFDRFLLGSVSEGVATRAHCSVEIVRTRAGENSPATS